MASNSAADANTSGPPLASGPSGSNNNNGNNNYGISSIGSPSKEKSITTTATIPTNNNPTVSLPPQSPHQPEPSCSHHDLNRHSPPSTPIIKKAKARPSPYPILLSSDRRSRKRKSLSWQPDDKIQKVHYFELIADERVNVTKQGPHPEQQGQNSMTNSNATTSATITNSNSPNASVDGASNIIGSGSGLNRGPNGGVLSNSKISNAFVDPLNSSRRLLVNNKMNESAIIDKCIEFSPWRPPILIDFTPELSAPGWNSVERCAQAERETYILGAIDLPGQPSTLDEPEQASKSSNSASGQTTKDKSAGVENIIPLENKEGTYHEWPDMYLSELTNGINRPSDLPQPTLQNVAAFVHQTPSQLLAANQQQLQLVSSHNPFNSGFQDLGTQFQQQQLQLLQPHLQQQQQQQQQQPAPFVNQQPNLTGPVIPWLSYPFNQVNETSHFHLFRQ